MACQRRTICSPKFFTGLLCGVVMGFLMGSIHLAIMNSQFYISGGLNPCLPLLGEFQQADAERKIDDVVAAEPNPMPLAGHQQEREDDPVYEDMLGVNNIYDYKFNNYDDEKQQLNNFDSLLHDKDIDKIYEVDISKYGLDSESEKVIFRSRPLPKKEIPLRQYEERNNMRLSWNPVDQNPPKGSEGFLYIGVMTAAKYVPTRGKAIMDTWAKQVPGKVELFVGEGAALDGFEDEKELNVVRLKKVDDNAYPPQKKSFMMLKYMYDKYLNGYEWFMRADDDAYLKSDKLENLLRKLNSSEPIFIGQTGLGNEQERGKLTLDHGENYCMGGPGMIFSREVIRRMAPNIGKCLRNMYTNHEDVEVSRCVSKYANVNCVWSYEMRELFYEHYTKRLGYIDPYADGSFGNGLLNAITLHPNKKPEYQRVLHNFFLSQKIKVLQAKLSKLYRRVVEADNVLDRTPEMEEFMLGSPLTLNRFRPTDGDNMQTWDFFTDRVLATPGDIPRRGIPTHTQAAIKDMVLQVMHMMNGNAKTRGRVISFQRVNYGYIRTNPLFGSDYVLDLLLHYNRYRGKKVSLPVRRHAYLQQTFTRTELYEDPATDLVQMIRNEMPSFQADTFAGKFIRRPIKAFAALFGFGKTKRKHMTFDLREGDSPYPGEYNGVDFLPASPRHLDGQFSRIMPPTVHLIVPLTGRFLTFQRFMLNLEKIAFSRGDPISVLIMLFMPKDADERLDMRLTQQLLKDYKTRYPSYDIRFLPVAGEFSRGLALEVGASQFSEDSLLFFCDVDVIFNSNFLRKCQRNTVRGETVYYPVLFSEFDPNFGRSENAVQRERKDHYKIAKDVGYWRGFGYGLLCVYQSDFVSTGGFDTSIKGWGLEDVDLFGKFVKPPDTEEDSEKPTNPVTAKPMRVHEPDLIHVYHQSHCSPELDKKQLHMCQSSKASGMMSVSRLYQKWRERVDDDERDERRDQPLHHQQDLQNYEEKDKIFYDRGDNER